MRSYQVFAGMSQERAVAMMKTLKAEAPGMFRQAVDAAAIAIKARPVYMRRQPFEKRAEAVRRSLARVVANPVADELLAVYFLECRKDLLLEWLDGVGLAHDDGTLEEDEPAQPDAAKLDAAVEAFLGADDDPDRELLLQAFAAQSAVEWPLLDARFESSAPDAAQG
ncbi:MAG: hypothetical protein ACQGVC_11665 [Myxococcota bacterium]